MGRGSALLHGPFRIFTVQLNARSGHRMERFAPLTRATAGVTPLNALSIYKENVNRSGIQFVARKKRAWGKFDSAALFPTTATKSKSQKAGTAGPSQAYIERRGKCARQYYKHVSVCSPQLPAILRMPLRPQLPF